MNKERLTKLADHIENLEKVSLDADEGFNMADYTHDCGSPSCIAGWAVHLFKKESGYEHSTMDTHDLAAKILEIDGTTSDELFLGVDDNGKGGVYLSKITVEEAVATIRNFVDTGEVDWSHSNAYESYEDEE